MSRKLSICRTKSGLIEYELNVYESDAWFTQREISYMFCTTKKNVGVILNDLFEEEELCERTDLAKFTVDVPDRERFETTMYSVGALIATACRLETPEATAFRRWGISILTEYLIKGFAMNDDLLKRVDSSDDVIPHKPNV